MTNIKEVGSNCASCGLCSIICPKQCIEYAYFDESGDFRVSIDESTCISCGLCTKICPVITKETSKTKSIMTSDACVFATHAQSESLRKSAASGGFITAFISFLFSNRIIDGALLSLRDGTRGKAFIAKSIDEVNASKRSIYAPVDFAAGVKELLHSQCTKVVVVGLPCQINSLNNLLKYNKDLRSKVFLTISIVCGKTPTDIAYKYIAKRNHFPYENIVSVENRGGGWPGYMSIKHSNGIYKVPYRHQMSMGTVLSSPLFSRTGCLSCLDGVGITSDIAVCDAWLPKYTVQNSNGWNLVLSQSTLAKDLLNSPQINNWLYLETASKDSFCKANQRVIDKYLLNNYFRNEKFRIHQDQKPSLKSSCYVTFLKSLLKIVSKKNKINLNSIYLLIGKTLNKLKD